MLMSLALVVGVSRPFGIVVGEVSPQVLLLLLLMLIKVNLNYKAEMMLRMCCLLLLFQSTLMIHMSVYLLLICELTPSAGIAALWASAGSED